MSTSSNIATSQKRRRKPAKSEESGGGDAPATTAVNRRRKLSKIEEVGGEDKESSRSDHNTSSNSLNDYGPRTEETILGWKPEQRIQLLDAILKRLPSLDWKQIADEVDGKSSTMCYDQWRKKMLNDIRRSVAVLPE
ncbi:16727_t:CDS:2 [Acaulospora morrowiae]|uniref:16727_t:CDS:1 n=1 Tax=Acaulospora morrowiae TaxID=94023 RepID=A0A9N9C481_9GLOM|nr:16727_t:CDS:2 [Acaulospora morrowiae]